jgi:catechol 2,3-dioxygenase
MATTKASKPVGVNHLVLNVRDLAISHRFYTDILGYDQVGALAKDNPFNLKMRFYSTHGKHHDIALVERPEPGESSAEWDVANSEGPVNHIAIAYPDRNAFVAQLCHLEACGIEIKLRGNHGTTHSAYISDPDGNGIEVLYELPREVWEGDINAALNYFENMPVAGPEALQDDSNYKTF